VGGHLLRVFERAAVGQVGGDPGGAECVAADRRRDVGRCRRPVGSSAGPRARCHCARAPCGIASLAVLGDAGRIDVGAQRLGERMMTGIACCLPPFSCSRTVQPAPHGRRSSTFIFRAAVMRAKL
jgi:hypothetical protein